jgi:hypothetical protein
LLEPHFKEFLETFNPLTFPPGFGFDPYTIEDLESYFNTPTQLEFKLKKEKGRHILYSQTHAKLRQSLLNKLPKSFRVKLVTEKFKALNLEHCCPEGPVSLCTDVWDVGMGHSIYVLKFPQKSWVVKREELPNQSLHCRLLESLGWPSFESRQYKTPEMAFEISEYLGKTHLFDCIKSSNLIEPDTLLTQLAKHAALGDVLGRGDRHYNNYMLTEKGLIPIDISFLFWEGNEAWDAKYIAGGLAEFSMLSPYMGDELTAKKNLFFTHYKETLHTLYEKQALLQSQLITFCGDHHLKSDDKLAFIQKRLSDIGVYFEAQKTLYLEAFEEMRRRQALKKKLENAIKTDPDLLIRWPEMRMYYDVDKDQPSSFFLLENFPSIRAYLES